MQTMRRCGALPVLIAALIGLSACQSWLVLDPTLAAQTFTPGPTVEAAAQTPSATPLTPSPSPTVTLTPIASMTPPIGATDPAQAGSGAPAVRPPEIEYFVAFPTEALPGDLVLLFWSADYATGAAIWRVKEDGTPGRTWAVEPEGELSVEVEAAGRDEEFVLAVTNGSVTIEQRLAIAVACVETFFFQPAPEEACPLEPAFTTQATFQGFERGQMFWLGSVGQIIVLFTDRAASPAWLAVTDPFFEGAPEEDPGIVPPPGLRQPRRGFGMVWRDTPDLRDRLGWALGEEQAYTATVQRGTVEGGGTAWYFSNPAGAVMALLPDGADWTTLSGGP